MGTLKRDFRRGLQRGIMKKDYEEGKSKRRRK